MDGVMAETSLPVPRHHLTSPKTSQDCQERGTDDDGGVVEGPVDGSSEPDPVEMERTASVHTPTRGKDNPAAPATAPAYAAGAGGAGGAGAASGGSSVAAATAPAQPTSSAMTNGVSSTTPTTSAGTGAGAGLESPSKSRRKQELVLRQAAADAEIVADTVLDSNLVCATLSAASAASAVSPSAVSPPSDDVKAHRRKQQTPKRKLMTSPTRLIARHKKVKLDGTEAPRGRKRLKVATKPSPSASAASSAAEAGATSRDDAGEATMSTAAAGADGDALPVRSAGASPKKAAAVKEGTTSRAGSAVRGAVVAAMAAAVAASDAESATSAATAAVGSGERDSGERVTSESAEVSSAAVDTADKVDGDVDKADKVDSAAAAAAPATPVKRSRGWPKGRPRKPSLPDPSEPSGSGTATVAAPAAAARNKPGRPPGSVRRRRRRPATGFVTRRPLVKRRPAVPKRTISVPNGHGAAAGPRPRRRRRKAGDLTIDMKEPFATAPGKTRSRTRSLTEEERGAGPARRGSRERPVNGEGTPPPPEPSSETAESPEAANAPPQLLPPAPDGVSSADWEAKWRCWNDDGSKKSWQATDSSSAAPSLAAAGDADQTTVAPPTAATVAPPAAPVRRRRAAAGRRRRQGGRGAAALEADTRPPAGGRRGRGRPEVPRGPYLHIGSSSGSLNVRVVNSQGEREAPAATRAPPIVCDLDSLPGQPRVGFSSAYAKNYDPFAPDPTWTCVFCRRRSHAAGLGDLYGPCFVPRRLEAAETTEKRQRRRSKRDQTAPESPIAGSPAPGGVSTPASAPEFEVARLGDRLETWFHESCLAWSPQLMLSAGRVQGIEEAVTASRSEMCSVCGHVGATVGCLGRGCRLGFHVPCAAEAGCHLDDENFTSYCSRHQKQE